MGSKGNERPENNSTAWNQSVHSQPCTPRRASSGAARRPPAVTKPQLWSSRLHPGTCFQESENVSTHLQSMEKASQSLEGPKISSLTRVIRMALALYGRTALSCPSPSAEDLSSELTL